MNVNYNELAVNLELKPAKTKNVTRIPVKCRQKMCIRDSTRPLTR